MGHQLPRPGQVTAWLLSGREQEVKLNIERQIGADNPYRAGLSSDRTPDTLQSSGDLTSNIRSDLINVRAIFTIAWR